MRTMTHLPALFPVAVFALALGSGDFGEWKPRGVAAECRRRGASSNGAAWLDRKRSVQQIKPGTSRKKSREEFSDSFQMPNCRLDVKKLLRTSVSKLQRPQFDALHRLVSTTGNHELAEKWQASEACPFRFLCLDCLPCVVKLAQKRSHRDCKHETQSAAVLLTTCGWLMIALHGSPVPTDILA